MSLWGDTIAAQATAPGRGGVAVVRVSGPDAFRIARVVTGRTVTDADAGRFFYAAFRNAAGTRVDDGLLLIFAAPHSYTGEDVVELQGHGGTVAPRRVLEACLAAGARLAHRGEFTQRAFLNGRLDLSRAEAVLDLIDARTDRAADEALVRLAGGLVKPFERLYALSLDLSSRVEHALDFSEEELPPDFAPAFENRAEALAEEIDRRLATAREGRLLREGASVVLAGAPNAGKSSLMNALLGTARALVSSQAGTTRDYLEEGLVVDGWPIRLIDTAGLRVASDSIEAAGVARAEDWVSHADIVVALDCEIPNALRIHAKCDLGHEAGCLNCSARTGEGLDELRSALASRLAVLASCGDETGGADVTARQQEALFAARTALACARTALAVPDWVIAANELRTVASSLGALLGKVYSDDLLDALFSRFCIGK